MTKFVKQPDWSYAALRGERLSTVSVYGCILQWRPFSEDADGHPCLTSSPARSEIAKQTGFTERTVQRATGRLVELGLIRKRHQGRGRAQLYLIAWEEPFPDQVNPTLLLALTATAEKGDMGRHKETQKGDMGRHDDRAVSPFRAENDRAVSPHREGFLENISSHLSTNGAERARGSADDDGMTAQPKPRKPMTPEIRARIRAELDAVAAAQPPITTEPTQPAAARPGPRKPAAARPAPHAAERPASPFLEALGQSLQALQTTTAPVQPADSPPDPSEGQWLDLGYEAADDPLDGFPADYADYADYADTEAG